MSLIKKKNKLNILKYTTYENFTISINIKSYIYIYILCNADGFILMTHVLTRKNVSTSVHLACEFSYSNIQGSDIKHYYYTSAVRWDL